MNLIYSNGFIKTFFFKFYFFLESNTVFSVNEFNYKYENLFYFMIYEGVDIFNTESNLNFIKLAILIF